MRPDHEQALTDIENLLPKVETAGREADAAHAAERQAELKVLERVVELLAPHFDRLADIIITRREEVSSEAQPSMNQFRREDYSEKGVLIFKDMQEGGTGQQGKLRIGSRRIYLLKGGRLLLVESDGFREEKKRRGMRPDKHEVWGSEAVEVTAAEALDRIALIEVVLDIVREQVEMAAGLAEDTVVSAAERTAKLLKLVDGMN